MTDRQDACLYVPRLWRELPNKASIKWQSQHTFVQCGVKVSKFLACERAGRAYLLRRKPWNAAGAPGWHVKMHRNRESAPILPQTCLVYDRS
jgi:hypothetical protein